MKVFLTGAPGIGKTTVVQRVVKILKESGLNAGGVYCPEIRIGNFRVGFEIIDLLTGRKGMLSHVNQSDGPRVGRYTVNLQDLSNIGVDALNRALNEADYIIIDEVGSMEFQGKDFQRAVLRVVEGSKPVLGILHWRMSHPIIDVIRARADVEIYEVTSGNRETIPNTVAMQILKEMRTS